MLRKLMYYLGKLKTSLLQTFSLKRIRRFGIRIAILDFISFMCHRSSSRFQLAVIRAKDRIVQKYIYQNYADIIIKYKDK